MKQQASFHPNSSHDPTKTRDTDPKSSIQKARNIGVQWILELHGWLKLIAKNI